MVLDNLAPGAELPSNEAVTEHRGRSSPLWRVERAGVLLLNSTADVVASLGLSLSEHATLTSLLGADGPHGGLTQTQLAERSASSPSAMTTRIDRLQARGLVERVPDPRDRRATLVRLTAAGSDLVWRALDAVDAAQRPLLSEFSGQEQETLSELLRRLILRLEEIPAD